MTSTTLYDPEGTAHSVEMVDAREYLKSGHYTSEPPRLVPVVAEPSNTPAPVIEPVVGAEPVVVEPVAEPAPAVPAKAKPGPKPKA